MYASSGPLTQLTTEPSYLPGPRNPVRKACTSVTNRSWQTALTPVREHSSRPAPACAGATAPATTRPPPPAAPSRPPQAPRPPPAPAPPPPRDPAAPPDTAPGRAPPTRNTHHSTPPPPS